MWEQKGEGSSQQPTSFFFFLSWWDIWRAGVPSSCDTFRAAPAPSVGRDGYCAHMSTRMEARTCPDCSDPHHCRVSLRLVLVTTGCSQTLGIKDYMKRFGKTQLWGPLFGSVLWFAAVSFLICDECTMFILAVLPSLSQQVLVTRAVLNYPKSPHFLWFRSFARLLCCFLLFGFQFFFSNPTLF